VALVLEHADVGAVVVPAVLVGGALADAHKDYGVAGGAGADAEVHALLEGDSLALEHVGVGEDLAIAGHGGRITAEATK